MSDGDELLDEALDALREEARAPVDDTLGRILDGLDDDRLLDEAVAALREDAGAADEDAALARVLASIEAARRPARPRGQVAAAAVAILALGLGAPTAWAWSSGRLPAILASLGVGPAPADSAASAPDPRDPPPREPRPAPIDPRGRRAPSPAEPPPRPEAPPPAREDRAAPQPPARPAPRRARGEAPRAPAEAPAPAPTLEDAPETRSFAAAHEAHFRGGDPHVALRLWDAHLAAYPGGRFELEARYNRALALVRLARLDEAAVALGPFARGAHGRYRQAEAARLLEAIEAREAP